MAYTTIDKPTNYFDTLIYSGNASNPRTLSGLDFQPDWVWQKNRTDNNGHTLADSVRGANKTLDSSGTGAELTDKDDGHLDAFTSDGFTVGAGSSGDARVNDGSHTYVAWNWKAGTSFSNDASSTSVGTIDSVGSVNQDAGFSIISYTGIGGTNQSVAHGLGATPKFIIIKPRSAAGYWCVTNPRFVSVSDPNILYLQLSNGGEADDTNINGTTAPSSTVFGVDDYNAVNTDGQTQIAYCFTPIKGYSSMSTYVGNGNVNGPFIFTGHKPAWILIRAATRAGTWNIYDNKRNPFNNIQDFQVANLAEEDVTGNTYQNIDMLSNGFKCRGTGTGTNESGSTYIYMAFAENPFVTSTGVPATAR
mgnify:FL=1